MITPQAARVPTLPRANGDARAPGSPIALVLGELTLDSVGLGGYGVTVCIMG